MYWFSSWWDVCSFEGVGHRIRVVSYETGSRSVSRHECLGFELTSVALCNYHTANITSSKPKVSLEDAFRTAEDLLDGQAVPRIDTDDPKNYLVYLAREGGSAVLAYRFIIKNKPKSILLEALVDAQSGQLVWIKDMVFHAPVGLWVNNWWNSAVWCEGRGSCILYLWIPVVV